ncbi:hypothetical protein D3C76_1293790 [compost metagenome]
MQDLIRTERSRHAHIGFITENVIGAGQFRLDRRHHQIGGAGAETDHRQATARTANRRGVQRLLGNCDGNGLIAKHGNRLFDGVTHQVTGRANIIDKT